MWGNKGNGTVIGADQMLCCEGGSVRRTRLCGPEMLVSTGRAGTSGGEAPWKQVARWSRPTPRGPRHRHRSPRVHVGPSRLVPAQGHPSTAPATCRDPVLSDGPSAPPAPGRPGLRGRGRLIRVTQIWKLYCSSNAGFKLVWKRCRGCRGHTGKSQCSVSCPRGRAAGAVRT